MKQLSKPDGRDVGAWGRLTQTSAKEQSDPRMLSSVSKVIHTHCWRKRKLTTECVWVQLAQCWEPAGAVPPWRQSVWGHVRGIYPAILRSLSPSKFNKSYGKSPTASDFRNVSLQFTCITQIWNQAHTHANTSVLQCMLFDIGIFRQCLMNSSLNGSILRDLGWNYCGFSRDQPCVCLSGGESKTPDSGGFQMRIMIY